MGKLSSKVLTTLDQLGRLANGDGLYLFVDPKRRRRWQLRYTISGRRRDVGTGPERHYSLAQVREAAANADIGPRSAEVHKVAQVLGTIFAMAAHTVRKARAAD